MQTNHFYRFRIKKRFSIRLIVAVLAIGLIQNVQAQQSELKIEAKKILPTTDTWETTLTITFSPVPQNGVLIETPVGLRLIPVSITQDNKHFWLQNSDRPSSGDSVLTWQMNDSGFFLYFNASQTINKNTLTITCITHLFASVLAPESEIRIRPFSEQSGNRQLLPQVIAAQVIGSIFMK